MNILVIINEQPHTLPHTQANWWGMNLFIKGMDQISNSWILLNSYHMTCKIRSLEVNNVSYMAASILWNMDFYDIYNALCCS